MICPRISIGFVKFFLFGAGIYLYVKDAAGIIECKSEMLLYITEIWGDLIDIYTDRRLLDNICDESKEYPEQYGVLLRNRAAGEKFPYRLRICAACARRSAAHIGYT